MSGIVSCTKTDSRGRYDRESILSAAGNAADRERYSARMDVPSSQDDASRWLLRPEEVAHLLNISRSKVYELLAAGELPSIQIGRTRRIRRDQLMQWLEDQRG
jgi:excisionase family DNA binding protein